MKNLLHLLVLLCLFSFTSCSQMPTESTQAIIGIAEDWNSSHVTLTMVEKNAAGKWVRVLGPYAGRLGRNGCVWGLGEHRNPMGATTRRRATGAPPPAFSHWAACG